MRFVLVVAVLGLAGCASVKPQAARYETGSFPEIGVRTSVNVGQVMVTRYDYLANTSAVLRDEIKGSFWAGRQGLQAGAKLIAAISKGVQVFCLAPGGYGYPCVRDSDGDSRFDAAMTMNAYGMLVNEREIPPAAFRMVDEALADGFKYELLYQGVDQGVVRVAYREYTENLARPAFSQDLTYTIAGDATEAKFRDVSMTIHSADNTSIDYTVTSGFGE